MGKKKNTKVSTRNTKIFPDKAYDPMKLFRSELAANNDKNAPRIMHTEDEVVDQEYTAPKKRNDRYSNIKSFLKKVKK